MEIFVTNIDPVASRHTVIRAIASELHRPDGDYSPSGVPVNFHFKHFLTRKAQNARRTGLGYGVLTLPDRSIGQAFLHEMIYRPVTIRGMQLRFRLSIYQNTRQERIPDPELVRHLRETDYMDPVRAEEMDMRISTLEGTSVPVQLVQFCWECRDGVISNEWEYSASSRLSLDYEERRIHITIPSPVDHLFRCFRISLEQSQIAYVSMDAEASALFFRLRVPPTFYRLNAASRDEKRRVMRRSHLPLEYHGRAHKDVAQYVGLTLRIVCSSPANVELFQRLCRTADMNPPMGDEIHVVERRGLFSPSSLRDFTSWVNGLNNFRVSFQLLALVHDQSVDPVEMYSLRGEITDLIHMASNLGIEGTHYLANVLAQFGEQAKYLFWAGDEDHQSLRECLLEASERVDVGGLPLPSWTRREDPGIFMCYHVQVTPTTLTLDGPIPERSNNVIRKVASEHHCQLIRVSFVEEGKLSLQHSTDYDLETFVARRVGPILKNGLKLLGRRYEFLAYSQSALKENSAWFLAPFHGIFDGHLCDVTVDNVIKSLGSFDRLDFDRLLLYRPARYAARISQGFTTTEPTRTPVEHLVMNLADIMTRADNVSWTHTDGVGTMSVDFARHINRNRLRNRQQQDPRRLEQFTRVIQIRFVGSKGLLSVDTRLTGMTVCLRPSMIKFNGAQSDYIEIARFFDRPGNLYLNRPLIMLMEGLGVPYETFHKYQDNAILAAKLATETLDDARIFLESNGLGVSFRVPSVLRSLVKLGINGLEDEPFYQRMTSAALNHFLRVLKHKARIPIPYAWNLPGICDVHDVLGKGEVFICINHYDDDRPIYVEGHVLIWRSPVIHPGDVQIAYAIGRPPLGSAYVLDPLANSLVFNVKDDRPLSTKLGGGDVDGDEYQIIPLDKHPGFEMLTVHSPGRYATREAKTLDRKCTHDDIADFFQGFITNNNVGLIANRWLEIADQDGIFDEKCMTLAELHNTAVDYPKTGNPAPSGKLLPEPRTRLRPDWKAPETMRELDPEKYYRSRSAIGKLFRAVDLQGAWIPRDHTTQNNEERRRSRPPKFNIKLLERVLASILASQPYNEDPREDNSTMASVSFVVRGLLQPILQELEFAESDKTALKGELAETFFHYRGRLRGICNSQSLSSHRKASLTEAEAVIGTILANSRQPRKRADHIHKLREQTDLLVHWTRDVLSGGGDASPQDSLYRAYISWELALWAAKNGVFGGHSFEYVALGAIFEAMREIEEDSER